jgi:phosphoenolpyruvate carboxykinase (ATP)
MSTTHAGPAHGLDQQGVHTSGPVHWNLSTPLLYEHALARREGELAADGPLVCRTGAHTGRSPNDKFVVKEPSTEGHVAWGKVNRPIEVALFETLKRDMLAHLSTRELYVQDLYAGADPTFRLPVRFI